LETNTVTGTNGTLVTNLVSIRNDFTNVSCVVVPGVARGTDPDGVVVKLEVFVSGTKLVAEADGNIRFRWTNAIPGRYFVHCVATDNRGAQGFSDFVSVRTVNPDHALVPLPLEDGTLELCFCAETNRIYGVEGSVTTDRWSYLGPFAATNSILQYLDTSITNTRYKFFRAVVVPP
jgi:hypothetical protein